MERRRLLPEQFFKYVTQPISREEMNIWVKVHNINVAKVSLFGDYLSSLYNLVNDTYLGLDVIKTDKEITGHFNWCWEKTIGNFKKEKLKNFINILFILHTDKTKSELDMLYEIYILLNESLTVK